MKSVVAMVMGGLGNQLFIYASNRAISLRNNRTLLLETVWGFSHDAYRRAFRLDRFPKIVGVGSTIPTVALLSTLPAKSRILRGINRLLPQYCRPFIDENHGGRRSFFRSLATWIPSFCTKGYWQDERYFADHSLLIRQELAPPAPQDPAIRKLGTAIAENPRAVFLHVRRDNYPQTVDKAYYQSAIEKKIEELGQPAFHIFGDNPSWALDNLDFLGFPASITSSPDHDELTDLWLMSKFQHAIIANSTFSWWGAWLADASTIAPTFTYPPSCVLPARWTVI